MLFFTNYLIPPLFLSHGMTSNRAGTYAAIRMKGTVAATWSFPLLHLILAQGRQLFCHASYALERGVV